MRRGGRLLGRPPTDSHIAPPANYRPQRLLLTVASDRLQQLGDGHNHESLVVVLGVVEVSSATWFQNTPGPLRGDKSIHRLHGFGLCFNQAKLFEPKQRGHGTGEVNPERVPFIAPGALNPLVRQRLAKPARGWEFRATSLLIFRASLAKD